MLTSHATATSVKMEHSNRPAKPHYVRCLKVPQTTAAGQHVRKQIAHMRVAPQHMLVRPQNKHAHTAVSSQGRLLLLLVRCLNNLCQIITPQ